MKHLVKIIVVGVCLGLILIALQRGLQIDEGAFWHGYWIAAVAVVIGAVLVNLFYNLSYQKKMRQAAKLLHEGKPQEYIAEMEALLQRAKGKILRNVLKLNLAAGYVETKAFEQAIPMLEELSGKPLGGTGVEVVQGINLCLSYFETGREEEAMALYEERQPLFDVYRGDPLYGGNIAILDALAAINNERFDLAEQYLDNARKNYDDPRLQKAFCEAADTLEQRKAGR